MSEETKDQGLRILQAEIKNFKNIDYREVEFNGRSVIIAASNQSGKSNFIQAVCSPINANYIPLEPIKQGEERGHAIITIGGELHGEDVEYKVATYFSQEHKRGRLVLEDKDGSPIKGGERGILNDIIGDISFDILNFVRLAKTPTGKLSKDGVRQQIEVLKSIMPSEAIKSLYALDQEKEKVYNDRTNCNREAKHWQGMIDRSTFSQEEIEKYSTKLEVKDLTEKIAKAGKTNENIEKSNEFLSTYDAKLKTLKIELEEAQKDLDKHLAQKAKVDTFLEIGPKKIDINSLNNDLQNISDHNDNFSKVKALDDSKKSLDMETKRSEKMTERLKQIDQEKKEVFANAQMPVKGLTFDEEKVLYKGLPLSEDQLSTAQLIGIGVKIGMALNPNLRLLVIKDGSLLDNKTMAFILKICEEKGYQLLIECVKHEGGEMELKFIEK